jgi:hypothetical protein
VTVIEHPFTGAVYRMNDEGNILVTEGDRQGVFRPDGRWVSGEIREADPQMCVWVSNVPKAPGESDWHVTSDKT